MGPSRLLTSKPIITAVSGYAVAGGMKLALMCDLRVMEELAIMGILCRRFGVSIIDGGRLPKLIGLSCALDLILTGRPFGAKEAFKMGVVNRVVGTGTAVSGYAVAGGMELALMCDLRVMEESAIMGIFLQEVIGLSCALDLILTSRLFGAKEALKMGLVNRVVGTGTGAASFVKGVGKHGPFNINKL